MEGAGGVLGAREHFLIKIRPHWNKSVSTVVARKSVVWNRMKESTDVFAIRALERSASSTRSRVRSEAYSTAIKNCGRHTTVSKRSDS